MDQLVSDLGQAASEQLVASVLLAALAFLLALLEPLASSAPAANPFQALLKGHHHLFFCGGTFPFLSPIEPHTCLWLINSSFPRHQYWVSCIMPDAS